MTRRAAAAFVLALGIAGALPLTAADDVPAGLVVATDYLGPITRK